MLIVLTVVAILIPTVFSIVFVIMRQQVRIYRVVEARRQGDSVLTFMKDRIVRSKQMTSYNGTSTFTPLCATVGPVFASNTGATNVAFLDNDDNRYRLYLASDNLMFATVNPNGTNGTATPVNNNLVTISNLIIRCARKADTGAPLISITYTVTFKDTTAVADNIPPLEYHTKIKLRE